MTMTTHSLRGDSYAAGYQAGLAEQRAEAYRSHQLAPAPLSESSEYETFGQLLARLRVQRGLSRNFLAHEAGMDPSYAIRIEHEERDPPRRHLVDALARVLFLNAYEYRQFVVAAGYAPVQVWTHELEATHRARAR